MGLCGASQRVRRKKLNTHAVRASGLVRSRPFVPDTPYQLSQGRGGKGEQGLASVFVLISQKRRSKPREKRARNRTTIPVDADADRRADSTGAVAPGPAERRAHRGPSVQRRRRRGAPPADVSDRPDEPRGAATSRARAPGRAVDRARGVARRSAESARAVACAPGTLVGHERAPADRVRARARLRGAGRRRSPRPSPRGARGRPLSARRDCRRRSHARAAPRGNKPAGARRESPRDRVEPARGRRLPTPTARAIAAARPLRRRSREAPRGKLGG